MLRQVRVNGYKSLRPARVQFDDPLTVIIGANASGKSNLFDALALLSRLTTSSTIQDAFGADRASLLESFSFENGGLAALRKKGHADAHFQVDFTISRSTLELIRQQPPYNLQTSLDMGAADLAVLDADAVEGRLLPLTDNASASYALRYSIVIAVDTRTGSLAVPSEDLMLVRLGTEEQGDQPVVSRTDDRYMVWDYPTPDSKHGSILTTAVSPTSTMFTEQLPFAQLNAYLLAAFFEMSRWRFYSIDAKAMQQPVPLRGVRVAGSSGWDVAAMYNTMKQDLPKRFESASRALRLFIPHMNRFDVNVDDEGYVHLFVEEDGTRYSMRTISEGTLRVLALFAIAHPLDPLTLIGIEEPENGVHPRRIELIARLLKEVAETGQAQVLVNTHSPVLAEYVRDEQVLVSYASPEGSRFQRAQYGAGPPEAEYRPIDDMEPFASLGDRFLRGDYGG